jgi:uncharacterized delta-60 repeat protein
VLALTAGGAVDGSFGASGLASLEQSSICADLAGLDDGRLVVAGRRQSGEGFAIRLLTTGQPDATFEASAVAEAMREATAVELAAGRSVIVAGLAADTSVPRALVMRLGPDGELDTSFGNAGSTLIDLPAEFGTWPIMRDIAVKDGKVLVLGGDGQWSPRPFVARLLGDGDIDGPGVVGVAPFYLAVQQQDGQAVVTVRRMGGRHGQVSVVLRTQAHADAPAVAREDCMAVDRTLTWAHDDVSDQQVVIPLLPDNRNAVAEEYQGFDVVLSAVEGGAGFGTRTARIDIAADGSPAGQFALLSVEPTIVSESTNFVGVSVGRWYYSTGAVSVTVTPMAGSATAGTDFEASPVVLTWASGDSGDKTMSIRINDDRDAEEAETFPLQLSAPTGGAVIGPHSSVEFTITRNDQRAPSTGSGGGALGLLSLLLLGAAEWMRRARRWVPR